jgi:hypothetical protein
MRHTNKRTNGGFIGRNLNTIHDLSTGSLFVECREPTLFLKWVLGRGVLTVRYRVTCRKVNPNYRQQTVVLGLPANIPLFVERQR